MAYGTTLKKGSTVITSRDSSRAGPHAEAGDDGRAQRRRHQRRSTSRSRRCRSPGSRSASPARQGGITVRLVERRPAVGRDPVLRRPTALDIAEDGQRKIERLFYREDFRRVFPGEIGDIGFPPRALETTPPRSRPPSTSPPCRRPASRSSSTTATARTAFVMPNVLAKLGRRRAGRQPVRLDRRAPWPSTAAATPSSVADLVRASGAHLGAVHRPRRRAPHARSTTRATCSPTPRRCSPSLDARRPTTCVGDRVALPVDVTAHAERSSPSHGRRGRVDEAVDRRR